MASQDEMIFRGELNRADSDTAFRWHTAAVFRRAWPTWPHRTLTALGAMIVMAVLGLGIPAMTDDPDLPVFTLALALGIIAGFIFHALLNRAVLTRARRLNAAGLGPGVFAFGPDGLRVEMASGVVSRTPWMTIKQFYVAPQHLSFWHDRYFAQYVPRAILGGREAELLATIPQWAPHLDSTKTHAP